MAESEIPGDIERAAVELWQRCLDERDADHVEIIAQALLAERERCAQAARDYLAAEYMADWGSLPDSLADAIKDPSNGQPIQG